MPLSPERKREVGEALLRGEDVTLMTDPSEDLTTDGPSVNGDGSHPHPHPHEGLFEIDAHEVIQGLKDVIAEQTMRIVVLEIQLQHAMNGRT